MLVSNLLPINHKMDQLKTIGLALSEIDALEGIITDSYSSAIRQKEFEEENY